MTDSLHIAVIGAGLAGLSCATALQAAGHRVQVFDKSRGPSGRLSTRRGEGWQCDHGAQYFTARDPGFRAEVARWEAAGVAAPWLARLGVWPAPSADAARRKPHDPAAPDALQRFVGTPRMTAPAAWLAQNLTLHTEHTVQALVREGTAWRLLTAEHGLLADAFDAVMLAVPSPQAGPLLGEHAPVLSELAAGLRMRGSWALMLRFDSAPTMPFDAAFVNQGPLRWVAHDGHKPGRGEAATWLLHASAEWSEAHIEDSPETVPPLMLAAWAELGGPAPAAVAAHRWRYADTDPACAPPEAGCAWLPEQGLGLCGDWLHGGKVEGAWLSGQALAARLMAGVQAA
jgi:renalase